MGMATVKKYLITIDNVSYYVLTSKDGSKLVKFELIKECATHSSEHINTRQFNDLYVLDSIHSGIGRNESNNIYNIVLSPILKKLEINHEYIKSTDSKFISEWAKQFKEHTKEVTIILISGDTSVSEFINSLPRVSKRNINILPIAMGTANALANSLNLNCPIDTFNKLLTQKLISNELPLYNVIFPDNSSKLFFIILSLGLHANLLHKSNDIEYNGMGVEKFQLASQEILQNYDLNQKISIVKACTTIINNFAYFALINVPKLEEHYIPSPKSKLFESELHVLGYLSNLPKDTLISKIMQGYENQLNDNIESAGTIYKSLQDNFCIKLPSWDGKIPRYKYEICCDGLLYNLLDFIPLDESRKDTLSIQFMGSNIKGNNIKVFSPV
ncbi:hypothetical protein MOUN0_A05490 [Monosporozyma unispora]